MKTIRSRDTTRITPTLTDPVGNPYSGTFTVAVVRQGVEPTELDFKATTTIEGKPGILVTGLEPGIYDVYAHVDPTPQHLDIFCDQVNVT